jgi:putative ABC transport system ATP-binding protein
MISCQSIRKSFENNVILLGVTFSLPSNGFFILRGQNGSGKSTLLKILAGFDLDHGGALSFDGAEVTKKNADWFSSADVSYISQDPLCFEDETVLGNVLLTCGRGGAKEAKGLLAQVGLEGLSSERAASLSLGEKERLSLAMALSKKPRIVLCDEVTANLDPANAEKVLSILREAAKTSLVVFATHEALGVKADGTLTLDKGAVSVSGFNGQELGKSHPVSLKMPLLAAMRKYLKGERAFFAAFLLMASFIAGLSVYFGSVYSSLDSLGKVSAYLSESYLANARAVAVDPAKASENDLLTNQLGESYFFDLTDGSDYHAGSALSGVFFLSDQSAFAPRGIAVAKDGSGADLGRLPQSENEVMISSLSYPYVLSAIEKNNSLTPSEAKAAFFSGNFLSGISPDTVISGVYEAEGISPIILAGSSLKGRPERASFAFMSESVFGLESHPFFENGSSSHIYYEAKSDFLSEGKAAADLDQRLVLNMAAEALIDSGGAGNNNYAALFEGRNLVLKRNEDADLQFMVWIALALGLSSGVVFALTFYFRNEKRYLALRLVGASRKEELAGSLGLWASASVLSLALGLGGGVLAAAVADAAFSSALVGAPVSVFGVSLLSAILPAVATLFGALFFAFLALLFLAPRDLSRSLGRWRSK